MWLIDAVYEYIELGAEYFNPSLKDMLNDSFLGLSVIALALVVWVIVLLIRDPKGKVRRSFYRNRARKEKAEEIEEEGKQNPADQKQSVKYGICGWEDS